MKRTSRKPKVFDLLMVADPKHKKRSGFDVVRLHGSFMEASWKLHGRFVKNRDGMG